jgi:hypothetical protein
MPVLLGGDSTPANLVVSCMGCNRKKGSSMESIESPYYASLTAGRAALDALDRGRESLFGGAR